MSLVHSECNEVEEGEIFKSPFGDDDDLLVAKAAQNVVKYRKAWRFECGDLLRELGDDVGAKARIPLIWKDTFTFI